jgi:hypothetical protein
MIWLLGVLLLGTLLASSLVRGRMFLYRHDERWRRSRGAAFGAAPLGLWWHDVYRRSDYSPEGQRLVPVAVVLEIASIVLAVAAFAFVVRAA